MTDRQTDRQTGYASIDKPWLKYYSTEALKAKLPGKTIYQYLHDSNAKNLNKFAINYFGKKITYSSMFDCIDKVSYALNSIGVGEGDIVSLCMLTMPETIYSIYALNHLGAICNNIEPRTNAAKIRDRINDTNSKILIVVDVFLNKILEIIDQTKLEHIIVVPISRSMPGHIKAVFKITKQRRIAKIPHDSRFETYNAFIHRDVTKEIEYPKYKKDTPAVIIYTGGTTGIPKGAVLSNDSITAVVEACIYDVPLLFSGERFLGIMPPFIAYGFVFGSFIPFCAGLEVVLIPNFTPETFDKLILKYKPNHVIGVPSFFERLTKSKKMKGKDLSYLKCLITGGDQLLESTENAINSFLSSHNCKYKIQKGYGMTEMGSAVTVTATEDCNLLGSVGVPSHLANVKIINSETGEELSYNQEGEICMTSPGMMLRYFNNPEETSKVKRIHSDGLTWVHTGDIGYMNSDGVIFIKGRIKRMIIRPDGHNVWPSLIEEVVKRHESISDCVCVGTPNPDNANGRIPTAFMVVKDGVSKTEDLINEIDEYCKRYLPERDVAMKYCYIDEIPLTSVGKVDYRAIENV